MNFHFAPLSLPSTTKLYPGDREREGGVVKDRTAPLEQVRRLCLCAKMRSAGKNCELLTIPGAGHVFNFRNEEKGEIAWKKTMQFLQDHVKKPLLGTTERGQG